MCMINWVRVSPDSERWSSGAGHQCSMTLLHSLGIEGIYLPLRRYGVCKFSMHLRPPASRTPSNASLYCLYNGDRVTPELHGFMAPRLRLLLHYCPLRICPPSCHRPPHFHHPRPRLLRRQHLPFSPPLLHHL